VDPDALDRVDRIVALALSLDYVERSQEQEKPQG
jgi:hypothetical protein